MGLILPADDVLDIADRVHRGDPVVGWRGDPEMDCWLDETTGEVAVYGFDAHRQRYLVTTVALASPGWRHDLLRRLRDGDWQRPDVVDRALAAQVRRDAEGDAALREARSELAEKLAWGIRRDAGHLVGASREFY